MTNRPATAAPDVTNATPGLRPRSIALVAVFAALITVAAIVPGIPVGSVGVPITLQTLAVMLTGLCLGPLRGGLAVLLYLVIGFVGFPVFTKGQSGLGVLAGPSAGYLGPGRIWRTIRPVLPVLVVLFAFQWWSQAVGPAARVELGITACYLAAGVVTGTTQPNVLVDGVVRLARPLRRWVDPEAVGIAVAVMFRSIPWVASAFDDVRDAARARGLERNPRALVVPVVIHTVADARATGEALAARGLGDPAEPDGPGPAGDRRETPGAPPTNGGAPG
ncbi:biotin transporter BioY [Intrasporangium sp.]|uniref:biotin transporter BioY n=1 Tax=Intrasporangium sp. TaxID=1925024 RepID=UPI0032219C96